MDSLREQVSRARRRLILEQFLRRLVWCLLAALIIAVVAIALPRIVAFANLPQNWDALWFTGALVAGLLAAAGWTACSNRSELDAAEEIDHRFELRERIASSLSLSTEDRNTEAGRALVNDALRSISRIDVDDKFRISLDRRAWWPLVPAAIAFVLATFVDTREASSSIDPDSPVAQSKQVKQSVAALRKKLEEQRKQAARQQLKAAEGLFKKIEEGTREITQKQDVDRTKAVVKLNDLAKQLEERRQELGGKDGLKKQFQNMKNLGAGPAEKAAQAMKQGDWKKAMEEIDKLAKALKNGNLTEDQKKQLAEQLSKMKEKLEAAAQAHKQAAENLKKQIEQQKKQGNLAKAGELQQKLDELQNQQPQMDKLQQLAQQMGQIQQGLEKGDGEQAAQAMDQLADQLAQMQQEMNEMEMLDAAMDQLEMAKDMMACKQCQGMGCKECQGGMNANSFAQNQGQNPGMGMGAGRGTGPRPDEENPTNLRDTRVRQKPGRGAATFGGMVEGPNVKGDVEQAIKEEMASLSAEPADPLTSERLPSSRREHAEEYFKILREGK